MGQSYSTPIITALVHSDKETRKLLCTERLFKEDNNQSRRTESQETPLYYLAPMIIGAILGGL